MDKFSKALLTLALTTGSLYSNAQNSVRADDVNTGDNYQLVWADEFNTKGAPSKKNWQYENGFVRNNELQWYQPQNAYCDSGLLIIEARRTNIPNPNYKETDADSWRSRRKNIEFTSASLNTHGLQSWKYGRFVMKGRIDISAGIWPAFWTLGINGPWPSNGEIDIMEYYKGNILANIATGTDKQYSPKWFSVTKPVKDFNDPLWASKFHVWRMDWDEKAISLFVDDELLNRVELKDLANRDARGENPFMQPHYILLNLAVGGDNGGDPSATTFPRKFEIDYVRVYQRKQ